MLIELRQHQIAIGGFASRICWTANLPVNRCAAVLALRRGSGRIY
jgi:hypothetical protein